MIKHSIEELVTDFNSVKEGLEWQREHKIEAAEALEIKTESIIDFIVENPSLNAISKNDDAMRFFEGVLMYSKKASNNFSRKEVLKKIRKELDVKRFGDRNYLNKIKIRFIMTESQSDGGTMRNLIGKKGNELFCRAITKELDDNNIHYKTIYSKQGNIQKIITADFGIILNKKPKFIDKSVDFIVLKYDDKGNLDINNPNTYIAAGELKSGIDRAGADEHWKTAVTALNRIHSTFDGINQKRINIYFIAGAVSKHMAREMVKAVDDGVIEGVANLGKEDQVRMIIKDLLRTLIPQNKKEEKGEKQKQRRRN